jgi:putative serine protease PepD
MANDTSGDAAPNGTSGSWNEPGPRAAVLQSDAVERAEGGASTSADGNPEPVSGDVAPGSANGGGAPDPARTEQGEIDRPEPPDTSDRTSETDPPADPNPTDGPDRVADPDVLAETDPVAGTDPVAESEPVAGTGPGAGTDPADGPDPGAHPDPGVEPKPIDGTDVETMSTNEPAADHSDGAARPTDVAKGSPPTPDPTQAASPGAPDGEAGAAQEAAPSGTDGGWSSRSWLDLDGLRDLADHPSQRDGGPLGFTPPAGLDVPTTADPVPSRDVSGDTHTDPFGMRRYYGDYAAPTTRLNTPVAPPAVAPERRRRGLALPIVAALVAALLGGGVGGAVGYRLAEVDRIDTGSPGVLAEPLPGPDAASAPTDPVEAVAAQVLPSVVQLRVDGPRGDGEGSGMVLSADGLLLTNNHVVETAASGGTVTAVFQDGTTAGAQIVGRDPSFDLAVLRARDVSGLTPIGLGNSDAVRVGQQVVAFGSPLGLGGTVTTGIISAINRPVSVGGARGASEATVLNALQTDAAINPGNSGGPLVDMEGKLIGINSAIATTGAEGGSIGVGFAIPVNQAKRVAEELERTGKATRAQLGVSVADDPNISGARIRSVEAGSAAEKAGIKAGDLVLRFAGQRILSGEGLQAAVRSRTPGETVEIELTDRKLSATLGVVS